VLNIVSSAAQYVRETISENIKDAKRQAKREGRKLCRAAQTPGYKDGERGKVEIDVPVAPAVKVIFEMYSAGIPIGKITAWANHHYPHARKRRWYDSTIQRMVRNPHYIGCTYDHEAKLIPSKAYPALVDNRLFIKCQERIKSQAGMKPRSGRHPHMASGFLTCGYCGKTLAVQQRRDPVTGEVKGYSYSCRYGQHGRGSGTAPAHVMERQWEEWFDSFFSTYRKEQAESSEASALRIQIARIGENITRLKKTIATGSQDDDGLLEEFADIVRDANREKSKLQAQLNAIPPRGCMVKQWAEMTTLERRSELKYMIRRVAVFHDYCIVHYQLHTSRRDMSFPLMKRAPDGRRFNNNDLNCWTPRRLLADEADIVLRETAPNWQDYLDDDFYFANPDHSDCQPSRSTGILRSKKSGERCSIKPAAKGVEVECLHEGHRENRR
jgi:hypothetical protein